MWGSLGSPSASLQEPDGGDRPLSMMAPDRDSQAVQFIKPDIVDRPGLSIGEDDGLAEKFSLGLLVLAQDRGCSNVHHWHGIPRSEIESPSLASKHAQVVSGTRQSRDGRNSARARTSPWAGRPAGPFFRQ